MPLGYTTPQSIKFINGLVFTTRLNVASSFTHLIKNNNHYLSPYVGPLLLFLKILKFNSMKLRQLSMISNSLKPFTVLTFMLENDVNYVIWHGFN